MGWKEHVARIREKGNPCTVLAETHEKMCSLRRPRRRVWNNIKKELKNAGRT
jgi:hypothetical protein